MVSGQNRPKQVSESQSLLFIAVPAAGRPQAVLHVAAKIQLLGRTKTGKKGPHLRKDRARKQDSKLHNPSGPLASSAMGTGRVD